MGAVRVTVLDHETGEEAVQEVPNHDFFVLTTGDCYVDYTQVYPKSGTVQLTIKGRNGLKAGKK